jgi:hypothetical protein
VVGSVVNSVKGPRKNIATATHFLGWKNIHELAVVLDMVCLSHFTEGCFNDLLVFVPLDPFDRQLTARQPTKSVTHPGALPKAFLLLFCSHFWESHLYSIWQNPLFRQVHFIRHFSRRGWTLSLLVANIAILSGGKCLTLLIDRVPFSFVVNVWKVDRRGDIGSEFRESIEFLRLV